MPSHASQSPLPHSSAVNPPQRRAIPIGTRIAMLTAYTVLTLPVFIFFAVQVGIRPLLAVDMAIKSVPLVIVVVIDQLFLDGGEIGPRQMPIWIVLTGVMLWPLMFLGFEPSLWSSPRWRQGIIYYSLVMFLATIAAAWWVFTHTGYFF